MTTDNLTQELARLNELDAKRTQGEWERGAYFICNDHQPFYVTHENAEQEICSVSVSANAAFIAAAPDAVALANKLHALLVQAREAMQCPIESQKMYETLRNAGIGAIT